MIPEHRVTILTKCHFASRWFRRSRRSGIDMEEFGESYGRVQAINVLRLSLMVTVLSPLLWLRYELADTSSLYS